MVLCEMCISADKKEASDSHHVIPRNIFPDFADDGDIIEVCRKHHKTADQALIKLLIDPFDDKGFGKRWAYKSSRKKYIRTKEFSKGICQMCNKFIKKRLSAHHTVPRFMGGNDRDIIWVCLSCHRKAEKRFENFYLNRRKYKVWRNEEKRIKRQKEIAKRTIFTKRVVKNITLQLRMYYRADKKYNNIEEEQLNIHTAWRYEPDFSKILFMRTFECINVRTNVIVRPNKRGDFCIRYRDFLRKEKS